MATELNNALDSENPMQLWRKQARVSIVDRGGVTMVRVRGFSPVATLFATITVAIVAGGFAYPIVAMLYNPRPVPTMLPVAFTCATVALAIVLALRRRHKIQSGSEDLIINDLQRTVSLPISFGRDARVEIPINQITEIAPADVISKNLDLTDAHAFGPKSYVKKTASPDDKIPNMGHRSEMQYAVVICWNSSDGQQQISPIVSWSGLQRTRALTFWLRDRIDIHAGDDS